MALIKCSECGHMVSEKAESCPNCGCPVEKPTQDRCVECGEPLSAEATECPNCGCPVNKKTVNYGRDVQVEHAPVPYPTQNGSYYQDGNNTTPGIRTGKILLIAGAIILVPLLFILFIKFASSNENQTTETNSPQMEIVLYNDDTGAIYDSNGNRLTGFKIYGRSGTIQMYLNSSISFFGTSTDILYLYKGKAYADSHDYIYNESTTGVPYVQKEEGTEIHYAFYNENGNHTVAVEKSLEQKIREAQTVEEVRKLLNGTTWHYTENLSNSQIGCWLKVEFRNGQYTSYYASPSDGHWTKSKTGTYSIDEGRYSNTGTKYIAVEWEGDIFASYTTIPCEFKMTTDDFELHLFSSFLDHINTSLHGYYYNAEHGGTHYTGKMEFGDYLWQ